MKKIGLIIGGVVVALCIALFFIIGSVTHSKSHFYKTVETAVNDKDAKKLQQLLTSDSSSLKIDKQGTQAFIDYMSENKADKKKFLKQVKKSTEDDQSGSSSYEVVKTGRALIFFANYAVKIKPMYFTVTTDANKVNLSAFGESIPYDKKKDRYGPLMPGLYNVKASVSADMEVPIVSLKKQSLYQENKNLNLNVSEILTKDKKFQKTIVEVVDECMQEYAQFWGNGLDVNKLTHYTEKYKEEDGFKSDSINNAKKYISKITVHYKGIQVNKDSIDISKSVDGWQLKIDADIKIDGKMDTIVTGLSRSLTLNGVGQFKFKYDTKKKAWLLNSLEKSFGDSGNWNNVEKVDHNNTKPIEWKNGENSESKL